MDSTLRTITTEPDRLAIEMTTDNPGLSRLVWSDYQAVRVESDESELSMRLLFLPRMLLNPSMQFSLLVRLAQSGPAVLLPLIRWIQVIFFSSEIHGFRGENPLVLGPGVSFPHPWNIIIGRGTKIGAGAVIYHGAMIGSDRHMQRGRTDVRAPRIGDRVVIYHSCSIQGPFDVGEDAVLGINVMLDENVPPGALRTARKLRLAGEWEGEQRRRWYHATAPTVDASGERA